VTFRNEYNDGAVADQTNSIPDKAFHRRGVAITGSVVSDPLR
jgi:hypothetical protein